jgi:hypothetical protein
MTNVKKCGGRGKRNLFEVVGAEINRPMAFFLNERLSNSLKI